MLHGDNELLKEFLGRHGQSWDIHLGSSENGILSFRLVLIVHSFNANWGRVTMENYFNNCLLGLKGSTNKGRVMKGPEEAEVIFFMPFVAARVGLQLLDGAAAEFIIFTILSVLFSVTA